MAYTSVKISADSSSYQSQMKSAASQMKVLSAEYTTAATKAKLFGSETDSLKAKAESLTQKITVQKNIVKLNSEQQEKLTKKLSDQKTKQEELKTKIDAAKEAYEKSTAETGKNSEQSKALKEELDKLEKEFTTNETAIGKTETALANQTVKTEKSKTALMNMEAELKNVNDQLKDNKLEKFATACDTAGTKMESFGKKMSVVSAGIAGIGAASIAAFKELDEGYDTIVTKTGATGEALEGLTKSADNVFGTMPEDMSTVGEAIGEVNTRFHTTGTELEKTSKQFIQFATINGTNVTQSVDQVDKIMKAWNVDASQTGNLLGLLTAKAQETGISVDTLESNVLDNNAAFKEMGLSLPQAINLMAQFDANGVDSTQAMAGLKKALQNATAEGKSMDEALSETIGSIKNAKTETEAMQIATELFGKKGAAEMTKAIRENRIDLTSLSSSMEEYGTTVEDTYNGTLDPIDNAKVAMNNAKLALSTLASTAQTSAAPMIEKLTGKIQELTKWFTSLSPAQQETILKVGLVVAAIGPLSIGFGKVAKGISDTITTGQKFVSGAAKIIAKITAKTIINIGGGDSHSYGQNAFFYDAAEGLLASVILLLAEFGDKNERHIVSVFKLIQDLLVKYQPDPKAKPKMYFSKLMDKLPSEHKAKWLAGAALNASDQSMLSVMSTALSRLNSFLDTEMEQLLCFGTAVDAEKFCSEKSAIFIVLPEEDTSKYFMVSLLIQQLYREILVIADENGGKLKNRVMFYCDEFGTFPKIEGAEAMFSAGRSRKISIVAIIQSFAQLEQNYGKQGMEIITDNTQLTVFGGFAPNSQSAEVLSKALGEQTVLSGSVSCGKEKSQSLQMIGRPLMTVDELKSMPKGQFIVMKTGTHPMISKLKLFFKWEIKFEEEYCLPDKTARQVCYKNRDELIRDVEVKYPQKKAVAAEIEVSVDDEEFDEFPMRKAKIKT